MAIRVPNIVHRHKFWYYTRKALFQWILPAFLIFLTFIDIVDRTNNDPHSKFYQHLYFYTSLILFIYSQLQIALKYIFSICADKIVFRKEISLSQTTPDLLLSMNLSDTSSGNSVIVTRKIFKLRYSDLRFFKYIDKICWFAGFDSPLLIPYEIVSKLTKDQSNSRKKLLITQKNEKEILNSTLNNLYTYHPTKYNIITNNYTSTDIFSPEPIEYSTKETLLKKLPLDIDQSIHELQKEIYQMNDDNDSNDNNDISNV